MKILIILLSSFFTVNYGISQNIFQFIPEDHTLMDSVHFDFNKDHIQDILLLCKHKDEENASDNYGEFVHRPFIILKGVKNNKYEEILRNDKLVLCYACGGVFGDPFNGIELTGDTLILGHYGGSSWKWSKTGKYYYNKKFKEWLVAEFSESSFNSFDIDNTIEETIIRYTEENKKRMAEYDIYDTH